jgi:hypothetical protein
VKKIKPALRRVRPEQITEQLNRVYANAPDAGEQSIVKKMKFKFRATIKERW